ncbi:MAG TPA: peptidoglycan recognition family protein [Gaiellaceae bacterium]|nr:peptidoglycan recognition family protein [Gaiellaceae bacterium]
MAAPRIITARSVGLAFQNLFGQLGPEENVTGHHSAGARAANWREGIERVKQFHADHKAKGWGGIGYHFVIVDDGTLICARPTILKGAHVGSHNTKNLGVNCPGTTGNRPTAQQKATYQWLLANAHTAAVPKPHRTDRDLRQARFFGHRDWPGHHSNACPGTFYAMFKAGISREVPPELEDAKIPKGPEEYGEPTMHGTTEADHRHVSPEEAEAAKNTDEVEEQLPMEDPEFDEEPEVAVTRGATRERGSP